MTMISTTSPARLGGADDGQSLQRRLLLDMERQWLSSWTQADQVAAEARSRAPGDGERQAQAGLQGLDAASVLPTGRTEQAGGAMAPQAARMAGTPAAHRSADVDAAQSAPAAAHAAEHTTAPCAAQQAAPRGESRPQHASTGLPAAPQGPMTAPNTVLTGLTPAFPIAATGGRDMPSGDGMLAVVSTRLAAAPPAESASAWSTAPAAKPEAAWAASVSTASPASPAVPRDTDTEAGPAREETDGPTRGSQAARASGTAAQGSDAEPHDRHRITLRELDASTVQATLRDAQLDTRSSELAARGLHHALMEAGYARIRVVVNGHAVKTGANDRDAAPDTPALGTVPARPRRKT